MWVVFLTSYEAAQPYYFIHIHALIITMQNGKY